MNFPPVEFDEPRDTFGDAALYELASAIVDGDGDSALAEIMRQWASLKQSSEGPNEAAKIWQDIRDLDRLLTDRMDKLERRIATLEAKNGPTNQLQQQIECVSANVERLRDEVRKRSRPESLEPLKSRLATIESIVLPVVVAEEGEVKTDG